MTACPSPDRLLAFAAGQLDAAGLGEVEAHIDACTDCRAALSNYARVRFCAAMLVEFRLTVS